MIWYYLYLINVWSIFVSTQPRLKDTYNRLKKDNFEGLGERRFLTLSVRNGPSHQVLFI